MLPDKKIWKYVLLPFVCILVFCCSLYAESTNSLWESGNRFYAAKKYDSALNCYRQIEQQGYQNAALYYNMGNAFYRIGNTAAAVLYYERALFKDPLNRRIKDNLSLAQARVVLPVAPSEPVFFISWWNSFVLLVAPYVWAWCMFLCFLGILWLIYRKIKEKEGLDFMGRWMSLSLAGFVFCGILFYAGYQARNHTDKAVVMVDNTPFFTRPGDSQSIGQLPEGSVVTIQSRKDGWYHVSLPNASRAWLPSKNVEPVQR